MTAMKFQTTHHLRFGGPVDLLDERADQLLEALEDMADVEDVDLAANLATGEVDLTFVVSASDYADVGLKAVCAVRAAIHQIGDGTPGWEKAMQEAGIEITPLDPVGA